VGEWQASNSRWEVRRYQDTLRDIGVKDRSASLIYFSISSDEMLSIMTTPYQGLPISLGEAITLYSPKAAQDSRGDMAPRYSKPIAFTNYSG